jgi:hypothetical protein
LNPFSRTISLARDGGVAHVVAAIGQRLRRRRARSFAVAKRMVAGKRGLEIGGPSDVFARHSVLPLYPIVRSLDNCNFAKTTIWEGAIEEGSTFSYDVRRPPGRQYILEATDLHAIPDSHYDFVISSHTLEHVANPLQALEEWRRVVTKSGALILVVPDKHGTFDHRRPVTRMDHLIDDFDRRTTEDDRTHLGEILALHDLSRDPPAGDHEAFRTRSEQNAVNRCLHHHVFDRDLVHEMLDWLDVEIAAIEQVPPYHIVAVAATR